MSLDKLHIVFAVNSVVSANTEKGSVDCWALSARSSDGDDETGCENWQRQNSKKDTIVA